MSKVAWGISISIGILLISLLAFYQYQRQQAPDSGAIDEVVIAVEQEPVPTNELPIIDLESPPSETPQPAIAIPEPIEVPLPEQSNLPDQDIAQEIRSLSGDTLFDLLIEPERLIRRIVVTADNLDRQPIPLRYRPVKSPRGQFAVSQTTNLILTTNANSQRYSQHLEMLKKIPPEALVAIFNANEAKFDKAYVDLGYPEGAFRIRLMDILLHLQNAPKTDGALALKQPKVFYEFDNPKLEALSFGQKIMLRVGPDNRRTIENYITEFRRALTDYG